MGCEIDSTDPSEPVVHLVPMDVASQDARMRFRVNGFDQDANIKVVRYDSLGNLQIIFDGSYEPLDSVLSDDSLKSNAIYEYIAKWEKTGFKTIELSRTSITTLDTTAHAIQWYCDTLGITLGMFDVYVLNDTSVYVVGELGHRDSTGVSVQPPFNVAIWNGAKWTLTTTYDTGYGYGMGMSVFGFSPSDIWVGSAIPKHWDGNKWTFYSLSRGFPVQFRIRDIWGTSSRDMYFVGEGGNIVHFDGFNWHRIESGTTATINSIWGIDDGNGESIILCAVTQLGAASENKLLRINRDMTTTALPWISGEPLSTVWFTSLYRIYIGGSGVHCGYPERWSNVSQLPSVFSRSIQGTASNDIFVVGDFGMVAHYNGSTWATYPELTMDYGSLKAISVNDDLIVCVGVNSDQRAVVYRGYR